MRILFTSFLAVFVLFSKAQDIKWLDFEDAVALQSKTPKKIFVDVYTSWCGWCKRMDATTFKDSALVSYMNQNYYAVKLDAESRDTFRVKGSEFIYRKEQKANDLAVQLLYRKMAYPTVVIIDETNTSAFPKSGYKSAHDMLIMLQYYGDNHYQTTDWESYKESR